MYLNVPVRIFDEFNRNFYECDPRTKSDADSQTAALRKSTPLSDERIIRMMEFRSVSCTSLGLRTMPCFTLVCRYRVCRGGSLLNRNPFRATAHTSRRRYRDVTTATPRVPPRRSRRTCPRNGTLLRNTICTAELREIEEMNLVTRCRCSREYCAR